jgi:mycofactocin precursor peptide MftA
MPYYCDLGHIMPRLTTRKVVPMEPNQQVEAQEELVTESLVEEVSIDGMCGVY